MGFTQKEVDKIRKTGLIPVDDTSKKKRHEHYLASCKFKVKYHSESHAKYSLRDMEQNGAIASNEKMNVYRCPFCNNFHIGHKKGYTYTNVDELVSMMISQLDEVLT